MALRQLSARVVAGFKGLRCGADRPDCRLLASRDGAGKHCLGGKLLPQLINRAQEAGEGGRTATPQWVLLTMLTPGSTLTPAHPECVAVRLSLSLCSLGSHKQ